MEQEQYSQIASFEKNNWWYRARRDLLDRIISSQNSTFGSILDAGCGVGSNSEVLRRYSQNLHGLDISMQSLDFCSEKGYAELIRSSLTDMRLGREFDLIVCMDVLEHVKNDYLAVRKLKEHLSENGILILSVPAHMYLWNDNDLLANHIRRYEIREIDQIVEHSGLETVKAGYWNLFAYLPCLIYYTLIKLKPKRKIQNNLSLIPEGLNGILYRILELENSLFMRRSFRQGVSIVSVSRRG